MTDRATGGYLFILAAAVLWGLIGLISRAILDQGVGSLEIAFWRALLGGALFAGHALAVNRLTLENRRDLFALAAFALVGVSLFYASLIQAIDTGGTSLAFILLYSAPLFVTVAAWLVLGEPVTARKLVLVPAATAGVVLVALGGGSGVTVTVQSLTWGLLSGLSYSAYYIFGKLYLHRYRPVTLFAWALPVGALALLPFVEFSPKSATAWSLLLLLASLSTYLAYLLYYRGLARVEASRAVLVALVEPVVALSLAGLLLGERFGAVGFLGSGVILLTAAWAALPPRRPTGPGSDGKRPADGAEATLDPLP